MMTSHNDEFNRDSKHNQNYNLLYRGPKTVSVKRRAKSSDNRMDQDNNFPMFSGNSAMNSSAMQTLDRRISASSDQLDTLKKQKNRQKPFRTRSSSRLSYERKFDTEEAEFKVPTFHPKPNNNKETSREVTKTPFEIFLEDDGPYSRKLYGPVTPKPSAIDRSRERQSQKNHSKLVGGLSKLRKEKLVYTPADNFREKEEVPRPVKKGLLWQQKDKFFSRWKERYFILTEDYLQCFKKENSRISEMGSFLTRLRLSDVEEVSLLTRKGYLTISLTNSKEGRILLRRHEGIREWFNTLKSKVLESKARQVHFQQDLKSSNLTVEAWLLARKSLAGSGPTPRATPYMAHQTRVRSGEEYNNNNNNNNNEQEDSNAPRGINRLSMVADLLQNESVTSLVQKRKEKQGEDSGLESGHTSMNTASDTQSDSNSGGEDSGHTPDIVRTGQQARSTDFDTFNIKTYQRRQASRYTNLPVTIV